MKKRRSDIPYAQQLWAKKAKDIKEQRDEAATVALGIMLCTLADEYGFGYTRLCKLAQGTMKNIVDFYGGDLDTEVEHLRARLRQLGFTVGEDGRIWAAMDTEGNPIPPHKRKAAESAANTPDGKDK